MRVGRAGTLRRTWPPRRSPGWRRRGVRDRRGVGGHPTGRGQVQRVCETRVDAEGIAGPAEERVLVETSVVIATVVGHLFGFIFHRREEVIAGESGTEEHRAADRQRALLQIACDDVALDVDRLEPMESEDRVGDLALGFILEVDAPVAAALTRPDQGRVEDARRGDRRGPSVRRGGCLEPIVALGVLLDSHELRGASPAKIPVERVVLGAGDDDVFEVDRPAEELDPVIFAEVNLHVVDDRSGTASAQGEPVELLVELEREPSELDANVLERAAVPVVVAAAEAGAILLHQPFEHCARHVDPGVAEQRHARPVARRARTFGLRTREYDRRPFCPASVESPSRFDNERASLLALDRRACFDRECRSVGHEHDVRQDVRVVGRPRLVRRDLRADRNRLALGGPQANGSVTGETGAKHR